MSVKLKAQKAKMAQRESVVKSNEARNKALSAIAEAIESSAEEIKKENTKDISYAKSEGISEALIDRLLLNDKRIQDMAQAARDIAKQQDVVGEIIESTTREDGMFIQKQRIPLGVIAMIFESRPNVVIDASCLAIKSGNSIILKGGKEARHSNLCLAKLAQAAVGKYLSKDLVQLIEDRSDVDELLKLSEDVDVVIPRGGETLIKYVYENAKMPVIAHFAGLCHGYIHEDANKENAIGLSLNAKTQRVSVCNAMETLLLHESLGKEFTDKLFGEFKKAGTELRVGEKLKEMYPELSLATDKDWEMEYLDNILSVKMVPSLEAAIKHIQDHGTHHTEFICTENKAVAQKFTQAIDASCIMVNASTRFNDGGELGLGAELGISTSKFHAYGPMGAKEMTTVRYLVTGSGHIRV